MDSNEFEKYFDVKATNQILGMQLLTADVMQDLIDFQNENNIRYDIVIENELYLQNADGSYSDEYKRIYEKWEFMKNWAFAALSMPRAPIPHWAVPA